MIKNGCHKKIDKNNNTEFRSVVARSNYIFQTDRLGVREITLKDTAFIMTILNTSGWLRFIGDKNVKTEKQAKKYIKEGPVKSYKNNGFGLWLVVRKEDGLAIGTCGILKRPNLKTPDIGFAFLPEFYGQGYAFEIATATLAYAKEQLHIPVVSAITLPDNTRSIRLLEKLGLKYIETIYPTGEKENLLLYRSS